MRDISRNILRPYTIGYGLVPFSEFFRLYQHFSAFRWVLEAIKIATESLECILSDPKIWSTCVDLLVNISTPSGTVHLKNGHDWFLKKGVFDIYK